MPPLRTRKGQWLLAILALRQGKEIERSRIAGMLWPDSFDEQANASLRRALTDLRQALGAQARCIESPAASTLRLSTHGAFVDVIAFDRAIEAANSDSLKEAVSLYQGPLLDACTEPWAMQEREAREQAQVSALEGLGGAALGAGDLDQAESWLRRAARADPLRESVHRGLMETLARRGDFATAVAVYRELRLRLREELNIEPDPQTASLYQRLRAEASATPSELPARAREARPAVRNPVVSLPRPLTEFIGRSDDLQRLLALMSDFRLVTLTGPGGIGKTRLSILVAQEYARQSGDDAFFVDLAPVHSLDLLPETIARSINAQDEDGRAAALTLTETLQHRRLLLVLDNCEHLFAACAELAERLLSGAPDLRILATSRRALGITGERVWRVSPLSLPTGDDLDDLNRSEAASLFVQRALAARPDFAMTAGNAAAIEQICRQLDGIPLALELAAARLKMLTAEQIATRLSRMFELLSAGSTTAMPRQRTLRAALDWSFDLLGEPERMLLRRLSVFPGRFDLEAAEAVCMRSIPAGPIGRADTPGPDTFLDLLGELVEQSLLTVEEHEGEALYRMLAPTHDYAAEQLQAACEDEILVRSHAEYFLSYAERAAPNLAGPSASKWLDHLEVRSDDFRAALGWFVERDTAEEHEAGLRLASALWPFWSTRYFMGELGMREGNNVWIEAAVWLEKLLARDPPHCVAAALARLHLANISRKCDQPVKARHLLQTAIKMCETLSDPATTGLAMRSLAALHLHTGDAGRARALLEEALDLSRRSGVRIETATCLNEIGTLAIQGGDIEYSRKVMEEALQVQRELGHPLGISFALTNVGVAALAAGDWRAARAAHEESLSINESLKHEVGVAWSLDNLAEVALAAGEIDRASELYRSSAALFRTLEYRTGVADCIVGAADICLRRNQPAVAAQLLSGASTLRHDRSHVSQGDRERFERLVSSVEAELGPEEVSQAQSQYRSISLDEALELILQALGSSGETPA